MVKRIDFTLFILLVLLAGAFVGIGFYAVKIDEKSWGQLFLSGAAIMLSVVRMTIGEKIYKACIKDYVKPAKNES